MKFYFIKVIISLKTYFLLLYTLSKVFNNLSIYLKIEVQPKNLKVEDNNLI